MADVELLSGKIPYAKFAQALQETCLINDPWYEGEPIFMTGPLKISSTLYERLNRAAERIGQLYQSLAQIVLDAPGLLDTFFELPPWYKKMWHHSSGFWHGFARLDLFVLDDGSIACCEINADTPTGQVEAHVPSAQLAGDYPGLRDPNAGYEARLWRLLVDVTAARGLGAPRRIGIVYPTDLPEDITLVRLYQRWFEARGAQVTLGSPYNLTGRSDGGLALMGQPIDVLFRLYKTDWWGERPRIFSDEVEVLDAAPLVRELDLVFAAEAQGKLVVLNPFGSVLAQDKLALAFFHEERERFSAEDQACIDAYLPVTRRLDQVGREVARREKDRWVLKSDFGCEGDEVLVGRLVDQERWDRAIDAAMPGIWVLQEFFQVAPVEGWLPNLGLYLIAGRPAGILARLAPKNVTTGYNAKVAAALIAPPMDQSGVLDDSTS